MHKQLLQQRLHPRLSPRQVQLSQFIQMPAHRLVERVAEELVENPALEEEKEEGELTALADGGEELWGSSGRGGRYHPLSQRTGQEDRVLEIKEEPSWHEQLLSQLSMLSFTPAETEIARYLLGSLDADGYLRRPLSLLAEELSYLLYLTVNVPEVERVLKLLQHHLYPAGVGARSLQECWLLQLERQKPLNEVGRLAMQVVQECFSWLLTHEYGKVMAHLGLSEREALQQVLTLLGSLSPAPLAQKADERETNFQPSHRPDFQVVEEEGTLKVLLVGERLPRLRIQKQYRQMLKRYQKDQSQQGREMAAFLRQRIERAHWFVEAIQQRQRTLQRIMEAIVALQRPFFEQQDEQQLRPIYLRHVAEAVGMDLSTISRAVKGKWVETPFGDYPLKYFFSEPISTLSGEEVSSRIVKEQLRALTLHEDKQHPATDDQLMRALQEQGIALARRTVAKYRKELQIPVARLRRAAWDT